jgi:type I restriction enzyme S subunit
LTSLDEVIAAQGQKVAALKAHKKGLMQQLFPREGETLPRLRFPEFRDKAEWEGKTLGELGDTLPGLSGKSGDDFGIGQPFVTYKQVFDAPIIDRSKCGRVKVSEGERQTRLRYGDVLFTTSSETPGEVGWASILLDPSDEPLYLNSFCFALRIKDPKLFNPEFARHIFHSSGYRASVGVLAQGSTRFNISRSAFVEIALLIPGDVREQEAIAACLSTLDAQFAAETEKLAALKTHKRGLMQQMFPSPEGD